MRKIIACFTAFLLLFSCCFATISAKTVPYEKQKYPHLLGNASVKKPSVAGMLRVKEKQEKYSG